jgi:endoglucanase
MSSTISVSPSGRGGYLLSSGYLSTNGSQIIDSASNPVRIASVGWNQDFGTIPSSVAVMKAAGFNTIRVSWVNATMSSDLQRIDQIVAAATANGMKVVLDNHTNEPGHGPQDNWGAQQKNGLWYDVGGSSDGTDGGGNAGTTTDAKFLQDWVTVAKHYAGNSTVIGFDLRNEPLEYGGQSTWGDGNINTDIRLMYQRVGNAIQAVNPGPLIVAEGPQNYGSNLAGTGPAPWGDLSQAGSKPVTLGVANKVVYSVHDYPQEIGGFSPDNGAEKIAAINADWGYLVTQNIAPVWIGEMGSSMQDPTDAAWAKTLLDYMNGKDGALGGPTFSGTQQGISGDWWAWGDLPGQYPNGTLNADGSLKADQAAVWSQMLFKPTVVSPPVNMPSADNTVISGTTAKIIDAAGNAWSIISGGQVAVNGVADIKTSHVIELAYEKGLVWLEDANKLWRSKALPTDQWAPAAGTTASPVPGAPPPPTASPGTWILQTVNGMQYMVLLPAGYDPTVKYATTLYLHQLDNGSFGASNLQNQIDAWFNTTAFRSAHPSIIVAPLLDQTADLSGQTINFGGISTADTAGETNAIAALKQVMAKYSTDPSRVYVTGNSMGGIGTWDMLIKYNAYTGTEGKIFAAGMPLAGADYGQGYPAPPVAIVQALKNVPIWAIHGAGDTQVPLDWDRNLYAAEKAAGGIMKYSEAATLSHDVWDTYYTQAAPWDWLYTQKTGAVVPPKPAASPDNTVVLAKTTAAIVDAAGNKWTITASGQVAVNGVVDATTSNVIELAWEKGGVWQENSAQLWRSKTKPTDAWGPAAGTTTSPVPVAPPKPVLSPDNTTVLAKSTAAITDAAGNKWTITASGQVAVNSVVDATTSNVIELAYEKGVVWQENTAKMWWSKTKPTDAWGPAAGTATTPVPVVIPPKPAASPDNTIVLAKSTAAITDAAGNKWTIAAGGQVAVNAVVDGTTANVTELAYEKGVVWQENTAKLWWSKTKPTDAWGPDPGTATTPVPVVIPPKPAASPDNTIVLAKSTTAITDAAGNKWTITAGDQVAVNGVVDGTTANITELAYEKGAIWQENNAKLWWSKTKPTDAWGPDPGTATSPVPTGTTVAKAVVPSISVTPTSGQTQAINAGTVGMTIAGTDTITIGGPGMDKVILGSGNDSLRFISKTSVAVTGGSGRTVLTADDGTNNFTIGKGAMEVAGGSGHDAYVAHAGTGALTIDDFSTGKGDTLTIDASLKGSMKMGSDGHGGTLIALSGTGAIDLRGVASLPATAIHWT